MKKLAAILALTFLLAACGGDEPADGNATGNESPGAGTGTGELIVEPASYDLVAGSPGRFIVGLLTPEQLFVSFGEVEETFTFLGTEAEPVNDGASIDGTGEFLAIEGDPSTKGPVAGTASDGRGVYSSEVNFDQPGFWSVKVTADLPDGAMSGEATFEVRSEPVYPAVGADAPLSKNLLVGAKDAPVGAIDSRAVEGGKIPDPELHGITVLDSVKNHQPALVVISTPVYCISRFCGPITDMVQALAKDYSDRANFIHIEVWRDFEGRAINQGAADWIYRGKDLTEPWIFLVGRDGKIAARWDNVAVRSEIEPLLQKLPKL
ncbi:MAG: hypothetical protein QOG54_319 [Actinomycetota bacterium]|nr:hypothetical protein [Actinomycetota bacterium]